MRKTSPTERVTVHVTTAIRHSPPTRSVRPGALNGTAVSIPPVGARRVTRQRRRVECRPPRHQSRHARGLLYGRGGCGAVESSAVASSTTTFDEVGGGWWWGPSELVPPRENRTGTSGRTFVTATSGAPQRHRSVRSYLTGQQPKSYIYAAMVGRRSGLKRVALLPPPVAPLRGAVAVGARQQGPSTRAPHEEESTGRRYRRSRNSGPQAGRRQVGEKKAARCVGSTRAGRAQQCGEGAAAVSRRAAARPAAAKKTEAGVVVCCRIVRHYAGVPGAVPPIHQRPPVNVAATNAHRRGDAVTEGECANWSVLENDNIPWHISGE